MPQNSRASLWNALSAAGDLSGRSVFGAEASIALSDLVAGSALYSRGDELLGRSVLVATTSQLTAASALIELDGIARRIVLYPPDLPLEHAPYVVDAAEIDAIVSDRKPLELETRRVTYFMPCSRKVAPGTTDRGAQYETEWVLLTSGTTGRPKMVVHTLASLSGAIPQDTSPGAATVWSTFYDFRRYGGLQIFLRAILHGKSFVLSHADETTADFLARAGAHGVTHISGTPTHWRGALMSPAASLMNPGYVRLSGEIADQGILNHLHSFYPQAKIGHAFASTEAGVAFDVNDGLAGFPESVIDHTPNVEMKVQDFSLRIRSARTASRYLGDNPPILRMRRASWIPATCSNCGMAATTSSAAAMA